LACRSVEARRAAIEPDHPTLSLSRQCELLGLARSTFYYRPRPAVHAADERLLRLIDEEYTARPFYGARRMAVALRWRGFGVGRRRVLAWRLSVTLETDFCREALEEALANFGAPEIFNSDQGSQFTSDDFTAALLRAGVRISRDGRGRALDNVFVERLWRSLKTEEVYLKDYADVRQAAAGIGAWFDFYNHRRPHQSLDYRTPDELYAAAPCRQVALVG
jgi:putative transposase